jgi:hypothetical protein
VAERLLARANQIKLSEPIATELWIYTALLADEAKEILGGLSLTTSYQAIALQHEAEVRAEVSFLGMSTNIKVKERLDCLSREVEQIQKVAHGALDRKRSHERTSNIGKLNCLLSIIHSLRLRFTAHEQIEASEVCLHEYVNHHHRYKRLTNWARRVNIFKKLASAGFIRSSQYLDLVTKAGTNVTRLFLSSVLWVFIFFVCFGGLFWFHPTMGYDTQKTALTALGHSTFTFIELQPGTSEAEEMRKEAQNGPQIVALPETPVEKTAEVTQDSKALWIYSHRMLWLVGYWFLLIFELIIAYVHLGLLISLLYRRITMRAP